MNEEFKQRLSEVKFVVEATGFEKLVLWQQHADDSSLSKGGPLVRWEHDPFGMMVEIGILANMPLCLNLSFAVLNGKRIMFWDAVSVVTHYDMALQWLNENCPVYYDGGRKARCDAMNFHLCLHHVTGVN
jgi:hypothetical protein